MTKVKITEESVHRFFKALGIETEEKRRAFLDKFKTASAPEGELIPEVGLSTTSSGEVDAELERTSQQE